MRAPDFRAVLDDGDQWLIEVKNVRCKDPLKQRTTMSAAYLSSLQAYAHATRVPLRLAIYWSLWNIWTLVAPEPFVQQNGSLSVRMQDALVADEFSRLGDVTIMTMPPLTIVLRAATDRPRSLKADVANFIVGSAEIFANGQKLDDASDCKLAEFLLFYGIGEPMVRSRLWKATRSLVLNTLPNQRKFLAKAGKGSAAPVVSSAAISLLRRLQMSG